jgi:hypothetical protein
MVVLFSNLLNIMSSFKRVGFLVPTMYRMLTGDIFRFLWYYFILLWGFSLAMYVLVHAPDCEEGKCDCDEYEDDCILDLQASPQKVSFLACACPFDLVWDGALCFEVK